jgi:hypothetical protein
MDNLLDLNIFENNYSFSENNFLFSHELMILSCSEQPESREEYKNNYQNSQNVDCFINFFASPELEIKEPKIFFKNYEKENLCNLLNLCENSCETTQKSDNYCINQISKIEEEIHSDTTEESLLKKKTKPANFTKKFQIKHNQILTNSTSSTPVRQNFPCSYIDCEKTYLSKENLSLHIKNFHLKEKPYTCSFCGAGFSHRNGKTYHERNFHLKIYPYKCNHECKYLFI